MGTPTLSSHPLGTHAKLGETDDTQLHYPKGFIAADDNTMLVKGDDSELAYTGAIYTEKFNITSAELLAISTTPKTIFSAKGSGKVFKILSLVSHLNFGTTAYAATDSLNIKELATGTIIGAMKVTAITDTDNHWETGAGTIDAIELTENTDIILTSASNPTTGDGTLDIYITYQILQ